MSARNEQHQFEHKRNDKNKMFKKKSYICKTRMQFSINDKYICLYRIIGMFLKCSHIIFCRTKRSLIEISNLNNKMMRLKCTRNFILYLFFVNVTIDMSRIVSE